MSFLDDIAAISISTVAAAAGVEVLRGCWLARCPACNGEHRSVHDRRRGCARVNDDRRVWHCYTCKEGGGTVDLLGRVLFGRRLEAGDPAWQELRAFGAARGWCSPPREPVVTPTPRPAPPPAPVEAVSYPPADEVAALWSACRSLNDVSAVDPAVRWLGRERGLSVRAIAGLDLARVIPAAGPWPSWLPCGLADPAEWGLTYRIVVPMFDPFGQMRSVRFRAVNCRFVDGAWIALDLGGRKVLNPRGHGYAGLVMADPLAVAVLRGSMDGWDGAVVVVEGEPDLLTWAAHPSRAAANGTFAVMGLASGSWTPEIAAALPAGSKILLRLHHDDAGDAYAAHVIATCRGRHRISRSRPPLEVPHAV